MRDHLLSKILNSIDKFRMIQFTLNQMDSIFKWLGSKKLLKRQTNQSWDYEENTKWRPPIVFVEFNPEGAGSSTFVCLKSQNKTEQGHLKHVTKERTRILFWPSKWVSNSSVDFVIQRRQDGRRGADRRLQSATVRLEIQRRHRPTRQKTQAIFPFSFINT